MALLLGCGATASQGASGGDVASAGDGEPHDETREGEGDAIVSGGAPSECEARRAADCLVADGGV